MRLVLPSSSMISEASDKVYVGGHGPALTTCHTAVRSLSCVADSVLYELAVHVEGFTTVVTGVKFVCGVSLLVFLQVADITET